ncbi:MAG: Com family DNA-binding transcriptional regulator [Methylotenera sp.]|nr:Com family DNA-binding transcriptional regulator [Methylotenera sp.]NOT66667.1 Com family DNA-binding transcriptional regulator [Methylotenera sp.]
MTYRKSNTEFRCSKCNKKLAEGIVVNLGIKCPRCGLINQYGAS